MTDRDPAPPESIERDGVSYVPRLWMRSCRDALDTCCNQLTATEADLAAALARAEAAEAHVREYDTHVDDMIEQGVMSMRKRITALIAAGDTLDGFADTGHLVGCAMNRSRTLDEIERNVHHDCDCGVWAAQVAWFQAKEGQS